jgi:hypothetical protein
MNRSTALYLTGAILCILLVSGCLSSGTKDYPDADREAAIPSDREKCLPETDAYPPVVHVDFLAQPVPLPYPLSTAGAEDSPFVVPDGSALYFFFTPDVRIPPERQVLDEVTGVWVSHRTGDTWGEPERVWLSDPGTLSLDGAVAIQGAEMFFASVREGYVGPNLFTARYANGSWGGWAYAGDRLMKEIQAGEVHLHGDSLYFHSGREGGKGGYDIWVTTRSGGTWTDPLPLTAVNSEAMDGFPFLTQDGSELWFTRTYLGTPGIFRSVRTAAGWSEPELVISWFAGEPCLDAAGNVYFVHHYYVDGEMIEADIYVAYRIKE